MASMRASGTDNVPPSRERFVRGTLAAALAVACLAPFSANAGTAVDVDSMPDTTTAEGYATAAHEYKFTTLIDLLLPPAARGVPGLALSLYQIYDASKGVVQNPSASSVNTLMTTNTEMVAGIFGLAVAGCFPGVLGVSVGLGAALAAHWAAEALTAALTGDTTTLESGANSEGEEGTALDAP